jgi:hypothetical protein
MNLASYTPTITEIVEELKLHNKEIINPGLIDKRDFPAGSIIDG